MAAAIHHSRLYIQQLLMSDYTCLILNNVMGMKWNNVSNS